MKKSKASCGKAKHPQQMTKEELIATLLKKKQCNANALSIVEGMLENEVNPQWLLDSLQFINQSHYQDAVEERSIMKVCGYPLCKNPLVNVPKQQFRISTQNNKVYDISERKNFCSNICYKSSAFLKDQIMTSPLWLRDIERVPVYALLERTCSGGGAGDEIDLGPTRVTAQEASIGHKTSDEPVGKSQIDDNQCRVEESAEGVSSKDYAPRTQSECDIPASEEIKPASSEESNPISSANEPVPKEKLEEQETKLLEEIVSGSSRYKEGRVEVEIGKLVANRVSFDSHSSVSQEVADVEKPSFSKEAKEEISNSRGEVEKEGKIEENRFEETSAEDSSMKSGVQRSEDRKHVKDNEDRKQVKDSEDRKQVKDSEDKKAAVRKHKRSIRNASTRLPVVAMPSVGELVEERLTEWFTVDSLCFLYGEQKTRELLGQLGGDSGQNFKPLDSATWDPEKHDRFVNICKRLNLLDLEDRSYDEKVINEDKNIVKKPLPDFNKLKEEAEKMDLRVQAFYKGQVELEPKKVAFAEDTKEVSEEQELPVVPLVHQHEQRALRRRLVLESLNRVVPDLLRTIGVHSSQVNSALRGLVGTFALKASNITFNPRHWTLVAVAIIKLLSVREARLHLALTSQASQKYLTLIQMSFNLGPTYLDLLMDRLVSSAIVLPKPPESG